MAIAGLPSAFSIALHEARQYRADKDYARRAEDVFGPRRGPQGPARQRSRAEQLRSYGDFAPHWNPRRALAEIDRGQQHVGGIGEGVERDDFGELAAIAAAACGPVCAAGCVIFGVCPNLRVFRREAAMSRAELIKRPAGEPKRDKPRD